MLVGFRVLQGLGGGMLMPLGMTIMTRAAGPKRMGRLMAVLGIPMLLGPIFGPILGGWLIDHFSWHWIFLINLPIGVLALGYAYFALPSDRPHPSESFDWRGVLMMSPGLALFLYGISSIPGEGGIAHAKVLVPGFVGLALIVAFVLYSFRPEHPLLDFRLFKNRNLTVALVTMFIFAASFFGGLLLIPQFLQQVQGETPLSAGWIIAPQGLGAMLTMPVAGALVDRFPVGRIVPFGLLLITGGMFALTQIEADSSHWGFIIPVLFVMGLGMGGTMMPIMTSALKTLTHHEVARGTTLLNITQQIASSVGVATFSVILTNAFKDRPLVGQAGQYFETVQTQGPDAAQGVIAKLPLVGQFLSQQAGDAQAGVAALSARVADLAAGAYAHTFWFAAGFVTLTLVSAAFLPRRHEASHLLDEGVADEVAPPAMLH